MMNTINLALDYAHSNGDILFTTAFSTVSDFTGTEKNIKKEIKNRTNIFFITEPFSAEYNCHQNSPMLQSYHHKIIKHHLHQTLI